MFILAIYCTWHLEINPYPQNRLYIYMHRTHREWNWRSNLLFPYICACVCQTLPNCIPLLYEGIADLVVAYLKVTLLPSNTMLASLWYIYKNFFSIGKWKKWKTNPRRREAQPNKDRRLNMMGWRLENQSQRTRNEKYFHLTQKRSGTEKQPLIYIKLTLVSVTGFALSYIVWPFVYFVNTSNYLSN